MDGLWVRCISSMGYEYDGFIIDSDLKVDEDVIKWFAKCGGKNKYALVYDPEYNELDIKKWGYDIFTE